MREHVYKSLPHERLDVYGIYLETASLCADIVAKAGCPIVALDHLDRAMESIGVNLMHGNGQPAGSRARANYLNVAIGSTHECAASLDICLAKCMMLDLMTARNETTESRITESKATQVRVIAMLQSWCERNEQREDQ